jgi:exosortase
MSSTPNQPLAPGVIGHTHVLKAWLPVILFGVLWADLVRQLSYTWETSEQYAFGWFVPFLGLALFLKRWLTRPVAQSQSSLFWLTALVTVVALLLLPVRVVYEINPDWPLCSWLMTLMVVGISLYAVFIAGGWNWVRHFAFPICFILVAVQWPYRIENGLTQDLMRVVATLTVELLGWFSIPAVQHGNLIEVSTGVVGISEACSGIRSFQSTLMAALFLGELYQLRWTRRLLLLAGGLATAFCLNIVRTLILAWHASSDGIEALDKWHDPAGMLIFLVSFACQGP